MGDGDGSGNVSASISCSVSLSSFTRMGPFEREREDFVDSFVKGVVGSIAHAVYAVSLWCGGTYRWLYDCSRS